jgi:hypothetical protein
MAYVYRHIRLDKNEPFYIGIGSDTEGNYSRANYKWGRNNMWNSIAKKCKYKVEIILDDITWEEACEKEKEFILLYGRINLNNGILCNFTDGGEGVLGTIFSKERLLKMSLSMKGKMVKEKHPLFGKKHTDDSKIKMSEKLLGKKMSPERLKKHSFTFSGEKNPMFGKRHSEETKKIISQRNTGRKHSDDVKKKMSESRRGEMNGNYGKKNSEATRRKMSQNRKNKIYIYNIESGIIYDSILEASKAHNIGYDMLKLKLYGKFKNNTYLRYA